MSNNLKYLLLLLFVSLFSAWITFSNTPYRIYGDIKYVLTTPKTALDHPFEVLEPIVSSPRVTIPITVFIGTGPFFVESYRDEENIRNIFLKANAIWNQVNISFQPTIIQKADLTEAAEVGDFHTGLENFLNTNPLITDGEPVALFIKGIPDFSLLQPFGGVASSSAGFIIVVDRQPRPDFEILAHELGHLFELPDLYRIVTNENLMSRGVVLTQKDFEIISKTPLYLKYLQ